MNERRVLVNAIAAHKEGKFSVRGADHAQRIIDLAGPRLGSYDSQIRSEAAILEKGSVSRRGEEVPLTEAQRDYREEDLAWLMNRRHDTFNLIVFVRRNDPRRSSR